jgi:hypothetical protein
MRKVGHRIAITVGEPSPQGRTSQLASEYGHIRSLRAVGMTAITTGVGWRLRNWLHPETFHEVRPSTRFSCLSRFFPTLYSIDQIDM